VTSLWRDARLGWRLLRRSPGFALVAVLALALGIGTTTAIFSVVHATLLAPLPFHEADRLVMVWSTSRRARNSTTAADFHDWRGRATVFQALHAWTGRRLSLSAGSRPEQIRAAVTTPGFVSMHGHRFWLGRDFLPEEGLPGRDQVIILNNRLWQRRFGADRAIVGGSIRVDGKPYCVVGVLAPGPADRAPSEAYVPLAVSPEQENRTFRWLLVMGRLKPGVSLAEANAQMDALAGQIAEDNPRTNAGWTVRVEPLQNNFLSRETVAGLWLTLAAVGFVLLIACANVAHLLLARGTSRRREVAVRAALGATRRQVFAQLLTESLMLAALGGVLGMGFAAALVRVILATLPANTLPSEADVRLNLPVLSFALGASTLAGLLAGCAPAWQAMRSELVETLRESGRSPGLGRQPLRRALVVAEFALSLMLLSGGGLAIQSLIRFANVELGFTHRDVLTAFLPVPSDRLSTTDQIDSFYRLLLERVQTIPGVSSASVSTGMPVNGTSFGRPFRLAGRPQADASTPPTVAFNMVTPDYFRTFGIPINRGRGLEEHDRAGHPPVAVVNEAFVKRYLAGVDPLSQHIVVDEIVPGTRRTGAPIEWQVVGVSGDVKNRGPQRDAVPEMVVPFAQSPWPSTILAVHTAVEPDAVRQGIAAAVLSVDPDLPVTEVKTMEQTLGESLAGDRFRAVLFGSFAGLALLLATVGIYGVMSFLVAQRAHEIGLRMALGARRGQVLGLVLREGMVTALAGTGLGIVGALLLAHVMRGMSYQVGVVDLSTLGMVTTVLLASALAACLAPARRAASVDPLAALRQD
jgi:putative ABC transport system permease protein